MGNSKLTMKIALLMGALNIAGDALLVYGLAMGTTGVAISTLIPRFMAAFIIIILVLKPHQPLCIRISLKLKIRWSIIRVILNVGVPYGIENGLLQMGKSVVLSLIATFGTAAIAANAVAGTVAVFGVLPGVAFNIGMTTVIARCIGAGDYEQAKYYNKKILIMAGICHVAINAFILVMLRFSRY